MDVVLLAVLIGLIGSSALASLEPLAEVKPHLLSQRGVLRQEFLVLRDEKPSGATLQRAFHPIRNGVHRVVRGLTISGYPLYFLGHHDGKPRCDVICGHHVERLRQRDLKADIHALKHVDELIRFVPRMLNQGSEGAVGEERDEVLHHGFAPGFHPARVDVESESFPVCLGVLNRGECLEELILKRPYRAEARHVELIPYAEDRSPRFADVDVRQVNDVAGIQDGFERAELLDVIRDDLHALVGAFADPLDGNAFESEKGNVRVQVYAPPHRGVKPLQHVEFTWYHPERFDDDDVGPETGNLAVDVVIISTFDHLSVDSVLLKRLYNESSRVPQPAGASAV